MAKLSAQSIKAIYKNDIPGLLVKVLEWETRSERAADGEYSLDTTQGRQSVKPPENPETVASIYQAYLKAYQELTGDTNFRVMSGNYVP